MCGKLALACAFAWCAVEPQAVSEVAIAAASTASTAERLTDRIESRLPLRDRRVVVGAGEELTTSQLRSELPDVPAGSLYRHVAKVVDGSVLDVVGERRVRAAVERTYVLRTSAARLSLDDVAAMSSPRRR